MKRVLLSVALLLSLMAGHAQSPIRREGNTFEAVSSRSSAKPDEQTQYTYKVPSGEVFPIYLSKNGRAYIVRTSKNGNTYKQYLGEEISRQICTELGREYVEKSK